MSARVKKPVIWMRNVMLTLEVRNFVATITLNNPPVNALTREWALELGVTLDQLEERQDWRVLHIRSSQKIFSAGANLKVLANRFELPDAGQLLASEARLYQELFSRIEAMPRLSLAEIGGAATGGGFELALACDLRIAAEQVLIGLPEVAIGLLPGAGGTQRLARLCGRATAMRLICGAELVTGKEGLSLGLVQWAVPATALAETAGGIAARFATMSPAAVGHARSCIAASSDPNRDGYQEELTATAELVAADDTKRRIHAFLSSRSKRREEPQPAWAVPPRCG
jgi:enoyl-CoA hydratase